MTTLTPEERADRAMAEVPTLTDLVVGFAKENGWAVFRIRQGRAGWALGSGWPDVVCVRNGRMRVIELKREGHGLAPAQERWKDIFLEVQRASEGVVTYHVWRPSDWRLGRIQEALS